MPSAITDELWAALAPLVERAKRSRAGAPPALSDRAFLEALLYLADAGCKWRQLPDRYGAWDAVYNRFRRWLAAGVLGRLFADPPRRPVVRQFEISFPAGPLAPRPGSG